MPHCSFLLTLYMQNYGINDFTLFYNFPVFSPFNPQNDINIQILPDPPNIIWG